jgi:hypothetical protein
VLPQRRKGKEGKEMRMKWPTEEVGLGHESARRLLVVDEDILPDVLSWRICHLVVPKLRAVIQYELVRGNILYYIHISDK